jgi:TRAP transporter TAXI family solute receptor
MSPLAEENMITSHHVKQRCFTCFCKQALVIATFLTVALTPFYASALDILLGTGGAGTFSHFTGRTICRMINKFADDLTCQTVPTTDAVDSITNLQGGALDIGLIDSRLLNDAINKTGYFEFLDISYQSLRTLVPLYDVPVTLVVRRDAEVNSLEEIKGKRINAGAPISLENLALDTIMKAKNWSKADFGLIQELPASQSQDTMAFCYGTVQAMIHIGVHPDSTLQQLLKRCKAGLVNMDDKDIEKLVNDHPALFRTNITADTYPSQPQGVATFGTRMMLAASDALDEQTVYEIIDVIHRNQKSLRRAHPALSSFTVRPAQQKDAGIYAHPGAARFFAEHGF